MTFQPDYRNILHAAQNKKPSRLPLYEHIISPKVMEQILGVEFADLLEGDENDQQEFFAHYARFFREMTYDTVSFEMTIIRALPDGGKAIVGAAPGPIQNRADYDAYCWDELPDRYWRLAAPRFDALRKSIPEGMKAIGGIGNGVFELSEDLVGLEYLAYMQIDDPQLYADLYARIGDLMENLWTRFLQEYSDLFCVCRFGDDLGFRSGTLTTPTTIRQHIIPQYQRLVNLIHSHDKPFLWHSCGCIFEIMDEMIDDIGIDAKHSNEDAICPYDKWIDLYGRRIGLFGGIDVDILCRCSPDAIFEKVVEDGTRFRNTARGFALGSGNSIPDYVPAEGYLAMVKAARKIRESQ